ncbi:catalase-like domain-containing protein [Helicostylum pulchrum]|nr:catalase-like domain-containing protein [Helicostylum pulchrum]
MKSINLIILLSTLLSLCVSDPIDPVKEAIVVDAGTQETTQFGTKINNTDSLQAGERGPTLQDFFLREKVMHFGKIPERVVHARGVGAHGYFQTYKNWSSLTAAKFLQDPNTKTPVFVRFSTVLGSKGSPDTVRGVRGFATRFYTQEGLWDLVGNVIAPFFIQDAIKFPDLIHAAKPEPDREVPQGGTVHCTAYDFFSQHTESAHTVMWALSGRGLVKSFRQVEGFGVHTFRLITEEGNVVFVKFIWKPLQGLSNLVWDEAQKIAGKDIDFHRNDLYNAIENGDFPEYELGVQIVPEQDEDSFDFDLLDATKIIPESIIPVQILGKMTLNHDPLLQGRLFSYTDTQVNRMNNANYMQIPINVPHNPVHNNQRDGYSQHRVFKGKVSYFPNKLQDNTPAVVSEKDGVQGREQRGKHGKFFDHFSQAQLFYNTTSLGAEPPKDLYPNANKTTVNLSIENYPRPKNVKTKKVAILTAPGIDVKEATAMFNLLGGKGAYVDFVGLKMGDQDGLNITQTYITTASVLYEAVYVPSGTQEAFDKLASDTSAFPYDEPASFIFDTYRHGKPIAASGLGAALLKAARLPSYLFENNFQDQKKHGVIIHEKPLKLGQAFEEAILKQRFWIRLPIDPNASMSPTSAVD